MTRKILHKRGKTIIPDGADPIRALIAAVTLRAVMDYLYPGKGLTQIERQTAADFVMSPEGRQIMSYFVPITRIQEVINENRYSLSP